MNDRLQLSFQALMDMRWASTLCSYADVSLKDHLAEGGFCLMLSMISALWSLEWSRIGHCWAPQPSDRTPRGLLPVR